MEAQCIMVLLEVYHRNLSNDILLFIRNQKGGRPVSGFNSC